MIGLRWGCVVDKFSQELGDDELLRYSRQILLDGWDMDAQIRLKCANVLLIGAGGLGCPVAQILTRAGVGQLHLIDHDVIDDSNLQRQVLFTKDDIGKPKATVAKTALERQNHLITITASTQKITPDNVKHLIDGYDLVIDGTDNFAVRDVINQACMSNHLPLLSNSAIGETGQIALFDGVGCYHCVFGGVGDDERNCANSGVLASTVAVIGSMTAQIALDYLGRGNNPIKGELLIWQGKTMRLQKLHYLKNPDCPVCAIF
ncbi:MAG: HesA/MoeB/ThiF family protein [Moraxella sp.]|nr:HesA/MoeB/ThiF family protein [Moraxella sp.]